MSNEIRDDEGYWNQLEEYIHEHSGARFSHGICQECAKKIILTSIFMKIEWNCVLLSKSWLELDKDCEYKLNRKIGIVL